LRQSNLNPLPADHDRATGRYPPLDLQGFGRPWRAGGSGAGSAEPVPGVLRDGAGDGADAVPLARMCATGLSSRTVTRCPASGDPAPMT
jgi:hypothetical protein